ncbi:MAG TPA: hypothetical protein IAA29_16250 [Candidatus Paenibacillus intestinavium]|nr:hypothetical protein [Candidatus Paenibacillus intestinavium]
MSNRKKKKGNFSSLRLHELSESNTPIRRYYLVDPITIGEDLEESVQDKDPAEDVDTPIRRHYWVDPITIGEDLEEPVQDKDPAEDGDTPTRRYYRVDPITISEDSEEPVQDKDPTEDDDTPTRRHYRVDPITIGEDLDSPMENTFANSNTDIIGSSSTPKIEVASTANQPSESRIPLDFIIYEQAVKHLTFRCLDSEILIYNEKLGYFELMNHNIVQVKIREVLNERINQFANQNHFRNVLHRITTDPSFQINSEQLDSHLHLINFRNCVLDINTMKTCNHSPAYNFTYGIKVDYLVDILDEQVWRNSRFYRFLVECTDGDVEKINALQEMTGYFMSNYSRAKKMFILQGAPHTGKSVWMAVWESIIGKEFTTSLDMRQLTDHKFMTAELMYSKLNLTNELDSSSLIKGVDKLKAITGGDKLTGEKKGKDPIHFYTKTKLVVACNVMPLLNDIDSTNAMIDRLLFINFLEAQPVDKRDPHLISKLKKEREYIILWAILGLQRLKANTFVFTEPEDSKQFKQQYVSELNPIPGFLKECCVVEPKNSDYKVHRKILIQAYNQYCKENELTIATKQQFYTEIRGLGVTAQKFRMDGSHPLEGFIGIQLR